MTYTYDCGSLKRTEDSGSGVATVIWDDIDYLGAKA